MRVLPEGPSADILHAGDIILAINGTEIIDIAGLRETMEATSVGDVITISILRDGLASDVDVAVGDRSEFGEALRPGPLRGPGVITNRVRIGGPRLPQLSGILGGILTQLQALEDRFVRAELVLETDDGFRTITAVKGTLSDIDLENGMLTVVPRDGADPIPYEISEDTVVGMRHEGDLGGLNTEEDENLVVAIDDEVKLVLPGQADSRPFARRPVILRAASPIAAVQTGRLDVAREDTNRLAVRPDQKADQGRGKNGAAYPVAAVFELGSGRRRWP